MSLALVCMSHSPLLHEETVPAEAASEIEDAFGAARRFVEEFDPELVVVFAPDHYNGFFYDLMPPFCIGHEAAGVGDYGSAVTPFVVPPQTVIELTEAVMKSGLDLAVSKAMRVDHGAVQPVELLCGSVQARPTIPVFVNAVAPPFVEMSRIRLLGASIGRHLASLDQRVLLVGSGGLSHDPPVPRLDSANPEQLAMLVSGRNPSVEARAAREARTRAAAAAFARGEAAIQDLNPAWDKQFLEVCRGGRVEDFDRYEVDEMTQAAGHSSHEVRTWVAAYSALAAAGPYEMKTSYYRPIPEVIAGFAVTSAQTSSV